MTQYDLILSQNVSVAGTEFSEKLVNIGKGDLLSGIATTKVPTVLAAGTDGHYLVRDDAEATGLKWIVKPTFHAAGTDAGTTVNTFTVDSDSTTGKIVIDVALGAADKTLTLTNQALTADVVITLPNVTGTLATEAYATGILAANDAMIYKGTVGTGGTIEKAALEALNTYNAGWTYRVITAGTYFSVVCQIGDLITCIVDRAGSGDVDTDWTVVQTNLDGAVIGPASVTDGVYALFDGVTGKLIKAGSAPLVGTDYIPKSLLTEQGDIIYASAASTPAALAHGAAKNPLISGGHGANPSWLALELTGGTNTFNIKNGSAEIDVAAAASVNIDTSLTVQTGAVTLTGNAAGSTLVLPSGSLTLGTMAAETATSYVTKALFNANTVLFATSDDTPAALLGTELPPKLWAAVPADKIGTGYTGTAIAGQIARDANYLYVCVTGGAGGAQGWARTALATNW